MKDTNLHHLKNSQERREKLALLTNTSLNNIGNTVLSQEDCLGRCENPIGATQLPLGVAGPVKMQNSKFKMQNCYIPLATTEGALVASVNRGCKAISQSFGVEVVVENVGASRGPLFSLSSIAQGKKIEKWLKDKQKSLNSIAQTTSRHLKLTDIISRLVGRNLFVRFSYDTQDAMGMNMVTVATEKIVDYMEKKLGISCLSLAGNFDIDKKAAFLNSFLGRGKMVWAEAVIKKNVVSKVLKTDSQRIVQIVLKKSQLGSIVSGSIAFNNHYANIAAAIFAATGQDLAHVVEASLGITTAEVEEDGNLYFSVYLPCLMVGTVGGGTGLPTQKEALSIMKVAGGDKGKNAERLAQIIGAAVLAGELSLTASLAEGSLAKTHQRFRQTVVI